MAFTTGPATITPDQDGKRTITLGFKPTWIRVTVGSRANTFEPYQHRSYGVCDSTLYQWCQTETNNLTRNREGLIIDHVDHTGTSVLKARVDAFVTNGVRFKDITSDGSYQIWIEAGN